MGGGRLAGFLLMTLSATGAALYLLWWAGMLPWLRPEDAVRAVALLVTLFFFTVTGFLGYVMVATKPPRRNNSKNT